MTTSRPREGSTTWMSGTYTADKLKFQQAVVKEKLSTLTETTIEFLSQKSGLNLHDFVGRIMTVHLKPEENGDDDGRMFTGTCISVEAMGMRDAGDHYVAQIRPWFWMLTRARNTRVFQEKTVRQIIEDVMGEHGFSDFEFRVSDGDYKPRLYCVQYRETDFDFLSRLMEEEGIYYFFDHSAAKEKNEKLIFCDGLSGHKALDVTELKYKPRDESDGKSGQTICEWAAAQDVTRGKVSLADYDFEKPSVRQMEVSSIEHGIHPHRKYEVYDHPGHYRGETPLGEKRARVRMESEAIKHLLFRGAGDYRHFATGFHFKLTEHEEERNNSEYLITETIHYLRDAEEMKDNDKWFALQPQNIEFPEKPEAEQKKDQEKKKDYEFTFGAVPKSDQFRAPLVTNWPEIPGIQIGEVVGPAGKEIYTDKYGRIKVLFRWDRISPEDDTASCWIRVVTQWSGNNYGLLSIPRIGQEVVIQFEDGDPDRPIVTGMMYNADTMPPYVDPDQPTRTGLMTRTSPDGGEKDYNALVFEDEAESEYVHIQSQKDYQMVVKDSAEIIIGHDEITVDPDAHSAEAGSLKQTVKQHVTELVEEGNKSETIDTGTLDLIVEGDRTEVVRTGNFSTSVDTGNMTVDVGTGNMTVDVGTGKIDISAATTITMEAMQKITLKVGGSSIEISQSGVTVKGTGTAKMEAPMVTAQASGILTLKGSLTKIN